MTARPSPSLDVRRRPPRLLPIAISAGVVLLAILIVGSYPMGWTWTGFADNDHLYDYLRLLVLPVVVATLPLWARTRRAHREMWQAAVVAAAVVFAITLVGGYVLGWTWTGYAGLRLWDWLELLVLPGVLALLPLWLETHERLERRWIAAFAVAVVVFVVLVIGGYGLGWAWTGFPGNTVWDWLQLMLVPFLLPAALTWYERSNRRVAAELARELDADPGEPEPAAATAG